MELYFVEDNDKNTYDVFTYNGREGTALVLRGNGYKHVRDLMLVHHSAQTKAICSNDESLLEFPYFWNEKDSKWNIYFWRHDKWIPIQDLTKKELRQPHALAKMYRTGEFCEAESEEKRCYWYKSHLGGLFCSGHKLTTKELYCEDCGDYDDFICYGTKEDAIRMIEEENQ